MCTLVRVKEGVKQGYKGEGTQAVMSTLKDHITRELVETHGSGVWGIRWPIGETIDHNSARR
jgi:hypothetical protein